MHVYVTDGEDVYAETRAEPTPNVHVAMQDLLAGPSAKEHARDVRSWIPHGTHLRSAHISGRVVRVDLGRASCVRREKASCARASSRSSTRRRSSATNTV